MTDFLWQALQTLAIWNIIGPMNKSKRGLTCLLALVLVLAACAPRTQAPASPGAVTLERPEAAEVDRAARAAWHRMELGFLESGRYTTNALVDLKLPQGARWTLVDFSGDSYTLRFTSTQVPGLVWTIDPSGVTVRREP